ncbi:MAG: sugar phosphate isomerase/epimerase [Puniceicoccales bacterium]|jgi:sugar phosphate isomerase/epimerase|nr:sugar phosphate isomerase/epimerase [Puniceicoccales bacterium]
MKHSLLFSLALALAGTTAANAVPIPEDAKIGGFAIGAQAYTFNRFSAWEAVEKAAHAGAKVIEFYPGQRLSKTDRAGIGPGLSDDQIASLKEHLKKHKVRAVNFGVTGISRNEAEARKLFDFAKKLELYAITTESVDAIDTIEKLAKEYDINVGFHNHPRQPRNPNYKVWDAKFIRDLVKDRDSHLGAAADVGHWATDGKDAVENLRILKGRIISLHVKDRPVKGRGSENIALGAGVVGIAGVLDELEAQGFKGNISIEHESNWNNNVPEVAAGIGFVRGYGAAKGKK